MGLRQLVIKEVGLFARQTGRLFILAGAIEMLCLGLSVCLRLLSALYGGTTPELDWRLAHTTAIAIGCTVSGRALLHAGKACPQ